MTRDQQEKAADDIDLRVHQLITRVQHYIEESTQFQRPAWIKVSHSLNYVRPLVRAMMNSKRLKETSG